MRDGRQSLGVYFVVVFVFLNKTKTKNLTGCVLVARSGWGAMGAGAIGEARATALARRRPCDRAHPGRPRVP